ncbi:hypothetical protein J4E91_009832 [Alternaria rosae]|nr:hypothetical protein J4E91_009832 [Alternaria rosae]
MLPPSFKRKCPPRERPFQDFDDAVPPLSNSRKRLVHIDHETGEFNPTWRRQKIEAYTAPKEDNDQKPAKTKCRNKSKKAKEVDPEEFKMSLIKLAPCDDPEFFASHFLLRPGANQSVYRKFSGPLNGVLCLKVKQLWLETYEPGEGGAATDGDDILKLIVFARLAAVHHECADAGYGENEIVKVDVRQLDDGAFEGFLLGEISKLLKRGVSPCGNDAITT